MYKTTLILVILFLGSTNAFGDKTQFICKYSDSRNFIKDIIFSQNSEGIFETCKNTQNFSNGSKIIKKNAQVFFVPLSESNYIVTTCKEKIKQEDQEGKFLELRAKQLSSFYFRDYPVVTLETEEDESYVRLDGINFPSDIILGNHNFESLGINNSEDEEFEFINPSSGTREQEELEFEEVDYDQLRQARNSESIYTNLYAKVNNYFVNRNPEAKTGSTVKLSFDRWLKQNTYSGKGFNATDFLQENLDYNSYQTNDKIVLTAGIRAPQFTEISSISDVFQNWLESAIDTGRILVPVNLSHGIGTTGHYVLMDISLKRETDGAKIKWKGIESSHTYQSVVGKIKIWDSLSYDAWKEEKRNLKKEIQNALNEKIKESELSGDIRIEDSGSDNLSTQLPLVTDCGRYAAIWTVGILCGMNPDNILMSDYTNILNLFDGENL